MNNVKILGVIAIIMGILAMLAPMVTGLSIAFVVGVFVTIAGIARLVWAFQERTTGSMMLMIAIGILTLLCGVAMLANPLFAAALLTILLATYFIADGALEVAAGLSYPHLQQRGLLIFAGIVSVLLGAIIIAQFPLSGIWAIGILFGIKLFFIGLIMVMSNSTIPTDVVRR
ncbi:MAG: DUF308 domain-containing protein [Pseudomonadota bacterium]|nr:DUF308 domain-containing protein [Pseudomonadota bacterium]